MLIAGLQSGGFSDVLLLSAGLPKDGTGSTPAEMGVKGKGETWGLDATAVVSGSKTDTSVGGSATVLGTSFCVPFPKRSALIIFPPWEFLDEDLEKTVGGAEAVLVLIMCVISAV